MQIEIESYSLPRGRSAIYFWIAFILVLTAVGLDWFERRRLGNLRSMSLEEQETILVAIDRTAIEQRLSRERAKQLRTRMHDSALPIVVDSGLDQSRLIVFDPAVLTISQKFFEADPISQERSLVALSENLARH